MPSLQRDVFIDEVDDRAAIEAALWNPAAQASRTGHAVGIGHDRTNTYSHSNASYRAWNSAAFALPLWNSSYHDPSIHL